METIKHAAVRSEAGAFLFIGKCHSDCFQKGRNIGVKMSQKPEDQGFMTSEGRYVQRGEAHQIALAAGMIDPPKPVDIDLDLFVGSTVTPRVCLLFSEDLWSREHGGKYIYDEVKGYTEKPKSALITRQAFMLAWASAQWGSGVEEFKNNIADLLFGKES